MKVLVETRLASSLWVPETRQAASLPSLVCQLPGLSVFPGDVNRVVEMQEKPFATVKKSQAKKIVVNESGQRP
jgi:hypothetical protein